MALLGENVPEEDLTNAHSEHKVMTIQFFLYFAGHVSEKDSLEKKKNIRLAEERNQRAESATGASWVQALGRGEDKFMKWKNLSSSRGSGAYIPFASPQNVWINVPSTWPTG